MPEDKNLFDIYSKLPPELRDGAKNIQKFAGYFLLTDPKTDPPQYYDWGWLQTCIGNRPVGDITRISYDSETIHQESRSVETMVDHIVDILVNVAKITVTSEFKVSMAEKVKVTFTSLHEDSIAEGGFLDFYREESSSNSSFTYRVVFAHPNLEDRNSFYALISTIKIMATIREKSTWWGLDHTTIQDFSAHLTFLNLACLKDFKAGPRPQRA